jgi:hypothetical protein
VLGSGREDVAPDVVLIPAGSRSCAEQRCGWRGRVAVAGLLRAVGDQLLSEGRGDLDVADAGLGLAVGDPEARAVGVVQPDVLFYEGEGFGDAGAGVAEYGAERAPAEAAAVGAVAAWSRLWGSKSLSANSF